MDAGVKRTSAFGSGHSCIPPKSRGRDSLATAFLAGDSMPSLIAAGYAVRPGVVARMGEPCLAGVVPRDTAISGDGSTTNNVSL